MPRVEAVAYQEPSYKIKKPMTAPNETAETMKKAETSAFVDLSHPLTAYEGFKMIVMIPFIVLRLLLLAFALIYSWSVLNVLLIGAKPNKPMNRLRQIALNIWISSWASFLLFISGFYWVKVTGWHHYREAKRNRAVIVFSHESYVDAAAFVWLFTPSGVAKSGVAKIPFFGLFARALQFLFVERKHSTDRINEFTVQEDPVEALMERSKDGRYPLVALAPEATTKSRPCLLRFRKGAFSLGQPILPVVFDYRENTHFYPGWGVTNTPIHVWRLMAQLMNRLTVRILPLYYPNNNEVDDPVLFAENVRQEMARQTGVELVDETLRDERILVKSGVHPNWRGTCLIHPPKTLLKTA